MALRQRLLNNEVLYGTLMSMASVEAVEMTVKLGYDWLFIDAEHGALGPNEVFRLIALRQLVANRLRLVTRVIKVVVVPLVVLVNIVLLYLRGLLANLFELVLICQCCSVRFFW